MSSLSQEMVAVWLANIFSDKATKEIRELAAFTYQKAGGNPFFSAELLKKLYRDKLINFKSDIGRWVWDLTAITHVQVSDNVIDFMLFRMNDFNKDTREVLKYAAAIGNTFDLKTLSTILNFESSKVVENLMLALKEEIVIPLSDNYHNFHLNTIYKFQHDRIHHAAYLLNDEKKRDELHLSIGRCLLGKLSKQEVEEQIIEIVRHFNLGITLIEDIAEKKIIAELNLKAALMAKNSSAIKSAYEYLKCAVQLLAVDNSDLWKKDYPLMFKLYSEFAECSFSCEEMSKAESICEMLLQIIQIASDRAHIYSTMLWQYIAAGMPEKALVAGLKALEILGLKIPLNPSKIYVLKELLLARYKLWRIGIKKLESRHNTDNKWLNQVCKILFEIGSLAYTSDKKMLFAVIMSRGLRLTIDRGQVSSSPLFYVTYAMLLGPIVFKNFKASYQLGKLGIELLEKIGVERYKGQAMWVYVFFIHSWNFHWKTIFPYLKRALDSSLQSGDAVYGGLSCMLISRFPSKMDLHTSVDEGLKYYKLCKEINYKDVIRQSEVMIDSLLSLMSKKRAEEILKKYDVKLNVEKSFKEMSELKYQVGVATYYINSLVKEYQLQNYQKAFILLCQGGELAMGILRGSMSNINAYLYFSLTITSSWKSLTSEEKRKHKKFVKKSLKYFAKLKLHAPVVFEIRYLLVAAELARIENRYNEAQLLYSQAIKVARRDEWMSEEALANNLAAQFYISYEQEELAWLYIRRSYTLYSLWGADGIADIIREKWKSAFVSDIELSKNNTSLVASSQLDFDSIVKISHALTSEMVLVNLLEKFLKIIQENAGGDKCILLLKKDKDKESKKDDFSTLLVQGEVNINNQEIISMMKSIKIADYQNIAASVVQYVCNKCQSVVLGNAYLEGDFINDQHIQNKKMKSLLCMPIMRQGNLLGVLYVENNVISEAFTFDRINILNIISAQAAISIENAILYQNLEEKVEERTIQLSEKNRDIQNMLQNMKQGIFTILPDNKIHHQYSVYLEEILENKNILLQDPFKLLFADSTLGEDVIAQMKSAIDFSFGGESIQFELNQWMLIREYKRNNISGETKILELDWRPILGEDQLIEKIMVIVRDVTDLRKSQAERDERELDLSIIGEILLNKRDNFLEFISLSESFIEDSNKILKQNDSLDPSNSIDLPKITESIKIVYRNIHTIKGNARAYNLIKLTDITHAVEDQLQGCQNIEKTKEAIRELEKGLKKYKDIYQQKLKGYLDTEKESNNSNIDLSKVSSAKSIQNIIADITSGIDSLAQELEKPVPKIKIHYDGSEEILFSSEIIPTLKDIFNHCIRNSLDHGIEDSRQRISIGKDVAGTISFKVLTSTTKLENKEYIIIEIADDGRGLNMERLRKINQNQNTNDEELAQLIFNSGISTADKVSKISGRGLGLDAVKAFITQKEGDINLLFLDGPKNQQNNNHRSNFRAFKFELKVPQKYILRR
ncbi:MAG: GAF domain-containing protein [Oligoflexia bacterium]|nr:GAF domain-containing protein [Oligoflexia bacterium]